MVEKLAVDNKVHAFDIDGTLTSNIPLWECLEKEYPLFKRDSHWYYDIGRTLFEQGAIQDKSEFSNGIFFTKYADLIYFPTQIQDYVLSYIEGVIARGDKVIFITARPESERIRTVLWLQNLGLPTEHVYFTNYSTKNPLLIEHKVTHFYEDKYETVLEAVESPYMENIYLLNYPYNQGKVPTFCKRIHSWGFFGQKNLVK